MGMPITQAISEQLGFSVALPTPLQQVKQDLAGLGEISEGLYEFLCNEGFLDLPSDWRQATSVAPPASAPPLGALVIAHLDWTWLFLGIILFIAVMVNTVIGRRASGARK